MFVIKENNAIYATRGDAIALDVSMETDGGEPKSFLTGDVVRMTVYGKKDCSNVVFENDFPVTSEAETAQIYLSSKDTEFGDVINKPTDFWYDIQLNPEGDRQTIVGYTDEGPAVFKLFPEGVDVRKM